MLLSISALYPKLSIDVNTMTNYNLLDDNLLIVDDIKLILSNIENSGFKISEGPQK